MGTDTVQRIARALGESEPEPVAIIDRLVTICGDELADELLLEADAVEQAGGLMLPDGSRRRTKGGVFFHLARQRLPARQRRLVFPYRGAYTPASKPPPWPELVALAAELGDDSGEARSMKITLIGRPGRVVKKDPQVVSISMQFDRPPQLPKQLPKIPTLNTVYTVFIAAKQWRKVEDALAADPEDELIIEGYSFLDKQIKGISVFAKSTTTKSQQRALREKQRSQSQQ
ncbi:hypothetical protein [Haliangium sp.]|uniref:hypothetical protein n=1 Tax=Haliangium sp. TaxID=2663208 RepID=UPI003D0AD510